MKRETHLYTNTTIPQQWNIASRIKVVPTNLVAAVYFWLQKFNADALSSLLYRSVSVSFMHKYNPFNVAMPPKTRVWRRRGEYYGKRK